VAFNIRACDRTQLPGVLAIYNEAIRGSTAVFSDEEVTLQSREAWLEAKRTAGYPVLVACDGGEVLGFGTFGDFRAWPGYRFTVEHSLYVDARHRRRGIGQALLERLIGEARSLGKHALIAGIEAGNRDSIRLHERLGFREVGTLHEVGTKFGRWLDLKFLERLI